MSQCFYWLNCIWNQVWMWWLSWLLKCADAVSLEPTRDMWPETITDRLTESDFFLWMPWMLLILCGWLLHASKPHVHAEYQLEWYIPSLVQSLSHVWLFAIPWTAVRQASLSFTISWSSLKLMSIELVDAIQPSHPLSSPSPPAFNLSQHQGVFQGVGSLHQVAKVLEPQLQHQPFQWIFRTDFL